MYNTSAGMFIPVKGSSNQKIANHTEIKIADTVHWTAIQQGALSRGATNTAQALWETLFVTKLKFYDLRSAIGKPQ